MVASAIVFVDIIKFVVLFGVVLLIMFVFPLVFMVFLRGFFLGNPEKRINTIRRIK